MSRPLRAGLALALLLLPLVPAGSAGVPQPAEWSPWTAPQAVTALAIAAQGRTVAAALAPYSATADCPPTACTPVTDPNQRYDLAILHAERGFVSAGGGNFDPAPRGRSLVAVSHDGSTIVSVGLDTSEGAPATPVPTLYYQRVADADGWETTDVILTRYLEGTPVGLLVSANGRRVAVASDVGGNVSVQGFAFQSGILSESFARPLLIPGTVGGFAGSADLSRLAVAALVPVAGGNRSAVLEMRFDGGSASAPHYAPEGVNLTRAAYRRDGLAYAVGGSNGTVLLFHGAGEPQALSLAGNASVSALAFSGDGSRLAAAANATVQAFTLDGAAATPLWSADAGGVVRTLSYNLTGGILAAAGASGVTGYNDEGEDLGWGLRGNTLAAAVDDAGRHVAYAQRNLVFTAALPRALALTFAGGADFGPTRDLAPGGSATYDLVVRNPGAAPERVTFRGPTDLDVDVSFEPAQLLVNPGETTSVVATLRPGQLQAGARSVNVTAVSSTSGLTDDVTLNFTLASVVGVSLVAPVEEVLAKPGQPHEILLTVRNSGTEDVAVSLTARQRPTSGPAWNVSLEPPSLTLPPDIVTTVRAIVTPPAGAENGTSNAITFVLEGAGKTHEAEVVYRINPTLGVTVVPASRVLYVTPGETATFHVNVTNTGSLPREFQVYYDVNDSGGRSWRVELDAGRVELQPAERRLVTVRVTAPADARSDDTLTFTVTAELLPEGDEAIVKDSVPLFAIAAEPVRNDGDGDGGNVIPAPAALLAVAAAGVVALLRRRGAP